MPNNPFEVTKAVDFTDQEIATRFVSFASSTHSLVNPQSPISQYLVGGKGGGRTHLMRYFSYSLQKERSTGSLLDHLKEEGYVGIYAPSSGLDGSRFTGAGINEEIWKVVYAQSLELRLVLLCLDVLKDIHGTDNRWTPDNLEAFCSQVQRLVANLNEISSEKPLLDLHTSLTELQQSLDLEVNNAPLTRSLNIDILFTPGSLIFGVGQAIKRFLPSLEEVKITYMLDELENLTEQQQTFVNTLVREKVLPTSFLIGSREWGIKTHLTMSAGEENKEGSEFSKIVPEDTYRKSEKSYKAFCLEMISKRLMMSGFSVDEATAWVHKLDNDRVSLPLNGQLLKVVGAHERRHLQQLRNTILRAVPSTRVADESIELVKFHDNPLLEKLTILRAFQNWNNAGYFDVNHFHEARKFIDPLVTAEKASTKLRNYLNLWKHDMVAQIYAENQKEQQYSGLETLIAMSGYLPRSLLVTLKYITARAEWAGEDPFTGTAKISVATQSAGIKEASAWYLNDVRPLGVLGSNCDTAIRRLGSLLRDIRYADKPSEVNVCTFSSNLEKIDEETRTIIEACVRYRMLVEVKSGRQARNQGSVHRKYQLHPMLSPFFGLGFGRRGDLSLSGDEVSTIFSPSAEESEFRTVAKRRTAQLTAPFNANSAPNSEVLF